MVLKSPAFRRFVFDSLSQRMAHLMAIIDDIAFRRVDQRLAWRLLLQRQPVTATHQMLADELGTTREVVRSWIGTLWTGSTAEGGLVARDEIRGCRQRTRWAPDELV